MYYRCIGFKVGFYRVIGPAKEYLHEETNSYDFWNEAENFEKKNKEVKPIRKSRCILKDVIKMLIRGVWNFLVILIVFVLAMVGAMPSAWAASEKDSSSATIYVPDDYPTIQAAVDAASSGDTIIVRDGEYRENINVKKRVTIKSENGSGNCIVNAEDREDDVFWVFADYVTISGFTVIGATGLGEAGIYLYSADYCNISNNICSNNECGIYLDGSRNNSISGNTFVNDGLFVDYGYYDYQGLFVDYTYHNTVENNTVNGKPLVYLEGASDYRVEDAGQVILINCRNITAENLDLSDTRVGIVLLGTEDSIIADNTVSNNEYGIYLDYSRNNTISGNDVSNNEYGIYLRYSKNSSITNNNCSNNDGAGIYLDYSRDNTISGNTFVNDGLFVHSSYLNTVEGNTVNNKPLVYLEDASDYKIEDAGQVILINCKNITAKNLNLSDTCVGIYLLGTEDSIIADNTVSSIYLEDSSNNTIYLNNFMNNTDNIRSSYRSTNTWNTTSKITYTYNGSTYTNYLGNYWSDYEGTDGDNDGIGDVPYRIYYSDYDEYPLMKSFEHYF